MMQTETQEKQEKHEQPAGSWAEEVAAAAAAAGPRSTARRELWRLAGKAGLLGLTVHEDVGGHGLDARDAASRIESMAYEVDDIGWMFGAGAHLLACLMPIDRHGSHQMRRTLLPDLVAGRAVAANCMTEPQAGSDIGTLGTRAEEEGSAFRLNGTKSFVTNGPVADTLVVYACTDPDAGFLGNSCFVVDAGTDGVEVGPPLSKVGMPTALASTVTFRDVIVPGSNLVGRPGQGNLIFQQSMHWERTLIPAILLGRMRAVTEYCLRFASDRRQFGQPLVDFQAVSHRIARMHVSVELCAAYLRTAAAALDEESAADPSATSSVSKYAISEAAMDIGRDAMKVLAARGYVAPNPAERLLNAAMGSFSYSGTNDVQLELVLQGMKHAS